MQCSRKVPDIEQALGNCGPRARVDCAVDTVQTGDTEKRRGLLTLR